MIHWLCCGVHAYSVILVPSAFVMSDIVVAWRNILHRFMRIASVFDFVVGLIYP